MELPIGFDALNGENCKFNVLRLNKSLYGLKQAGCNWFAKLKMDFKIVDLCRAILILVFPLGLDALSLLMWMFASLLETRPIILTN